MKKLIPTPKSRRRKMAARLAKKFTQSPPETFGAKAPIELHTVEDSRVEYPEFTFWNWIFIFILCLAIVVAFALF